MPLPAETAEGENQVGESILNVHCACARINEALQMFTSVDFKTSDQHKDSSSAEITQLKSLNT